MKQSLLPILTLILLFIGSGCIFDSDEGEDATWTVSVDSVSVRFVEDRTVFFAAYGWVPNPCYDFSRFELRKSNKDYYITVKANPQGSELCPTVLHYLTSPVYFEVDAPGTYSFHFWQSDTTTVDTTFAIP